MPRLTLPLTAAALLLLSACGDKNKAADIPPATAIAASPSAAMHDSVASVEVIPPAPSTAEAPLVAGRAPVPAEKPSSKPTATKPTPVPSRPSTASGNAASNTPSPARGSGTVAAGTNISVSNGAKLCTNTAQVGDKLTVTTNSAIGASNGVSIPAGARVGLVVTKANTSSHTGEEALLAFDVRSLTFGGDTYTVSGSVATDAIVTERKGGDGKKVAIGAAAGAVIGNIIGGGSRVQRTVVGAAAGGLAGAATAAVTGDRFACLPEGANLTVHLGSALTVKN
jgi:hypothetical protein